MKGLIESPLFVELAKQAIFRILWRGPSPTELEIQRRRKLVEKLDETIQRLEERVKSQKSMVSPQGAGHVGALPAEAKDAIAEIAAILKEARRFALEGGLDHPEARRRIDDAQVAITRLERFTLAPGAGGTNLLPHIRRLRQRLFNELSSPTDLDRAAEEAGRLHVALVHGAVLRSPDKAPESVSVGCIPCAKAHLAGVHGMLREATRLAKDEGMTEEVARRVAAAKEELVALLRYDWSPDRLSEVSPEERRVVERYLPQVQGLLRQLDSAVSPDALERLERAVGGMRVGLIVSHKHPHTAIKIGG